MSMMDSPRGNCEGGERSQILPPTPSRSQRARKRLASFGKRLIVFFFSQIGLTCLVVAYAVMGGFVFKALEHSKEKQSRQDVTITRHEFVERMWNVTKSLNILHEPNWTAEADIIFKNFQDEVYKAVKGGWDGQEAADNENFEWTFAGSLLFAVTVITTIGLYETAGRASNAAKSAPCSSARILSSCQFPAVAYAFALTSVLCLRTLMLCRGVRCSFTMKL